MARTRRSTKDETPATKGGPIAVGALTGVSVAVVRFVVVVVVVIVVLVEVEVVVEVVVVVAVVVLVVVVVAVVVAIVGLVVVDCFVRLQGQGLSLLPTFFTHFFFLGEYVHTLWEMIH